MSQYADIIERLEKATGPDDDLDLDIINLIDPPVARYSAMHQPLTSSLDAAIALVERMLPGCIWTIEQDACWLRTMRGDDVKEHQGFLTGRDGKCTPIAILIAMFCALETEAQP